jgi:hypothetical protein
MEDLHSIVYKSEATRALTAQDLDRLLLDARSFNEGAGVTGVLLYHAGSFFQFFEGPEQGATAVYRRICQSTIHNNIVELLNTTASERQFESWHMGFCSPPQTELQLLATASWEDAIPMTRSTQKRSQGLGLLLNYWSKWTAESSLVGTTPPILPSAPSA